MSSLSWFHSSTIKTQSWDVWDTFKATALKCSTSKQKVNVKKRWPRGRRRRECGAVGILGPIEAIVICNIHSNVPYQMQQVWHCSEREISLVPYSALVTPRANSDKWIYLDNAYGTIEEDVQKAKRVERRRGTRLTTHLICPFFLPLCLWLDLNKRCWSLFKNSCKDNVAFLSIQTRHSYWKRARTKQIQCLDVVKIKVQAVNPSVRLSSSGIIVRKCYHSRFLL